MWPRAKNKAADAVSDTLGTLVVHWALYIDARRAYSKSYRRFRSGDLSIEQYLTVCEAYTNVCELLRESHKRYRGAMRKQLESMRESRAIGKRRQDGQN